MSHVILGRHKPDTILLLRLRKPEWWFSLFMLVLGFYFLNPDVDTFSRGSYAVMKDMASFVFISQGAAEIILGAGMIGAGVLGLVILIINGRIRRSPELRALMAGGRLLIWGFLSLCILFSQEQTPAWILYGGLALAELTNVIDASLDRISSWMTGHRADQAATIMAKYKDGGHLVRPDVGEGNHAGRARSSA